MLALLASISLASCHSSSIDTRPNNDPEGLPSPPVNLIGSPYSDSEIRLVWGPAVDDGWITGYDIKRDGATLSTNLDALSYAVASVVAATTYSYSVFAVDNEGNRGPAAALSISSPSRAPAVAARYAASIEPSCSSSGRFV